MGGLVLIITIGLSIGSGIMAWNIVDPSNFWGGIAFLILWGVLSKVAYIIAGGIVALLFDE